MNYMINNINYNKSSNKLNLEMTSEGRSFNKIELKLWRSSN